MKSKGLVGIRRNYLEVLRIQSREESGELFSARRASEVLRGNGRSKTIRPRPRGLVRALEIKDNHREYFEICQVIGEDSTSTLESRRQQS